MSIGVLKGVPTLKEDGLVGFLTMIFTVQKYAVIFMITVRVYHISWILMTSHYTMIVMVINIIMIRMMIFIIIMIVMNIQIILKMMNIRIDE